MDPERLRSRVKFLNMIGWKGVFISIPIMSESMGEKNITGIAKSIGVYHHR
jgi:hypothetical protein